VPIVVKQTWNLLGPLRLLDIVKNSIDTIDFNMEYATSRDKFNTQIYG